MKYSLLLGLSVMLICCNDNKDNNNPVDKVIIKQPDTINTIINKEVLINELKNLQKILASEDVNKIKSIFNFPVPDTALQVLSLDESINNDVKSNKGLIDENIFVKYFTKFYKQWDVNYLNELFKYIDINGLNDKDELEYQTSDKNNPVTKFLRISIVNDTLSLQYGGRPNFESEKLKKNPDAEFDYPDFSIMWNFKFDGKKLIFIRQNFAG